MTTALCHSFTCPPTRADRAVQGLPARLPVSSPIRGCDHTRIKMQASRNPDDRMIPADLRQIAGNHASTVKKSSSLRPGRELSQ